MKRTIVATHAELDQVMGRSPDAWLLLLLLRRHHWDSPFAIANTMAATMPGGAWTRKRLAAARAVLIDEGKIEQVRPPSRHTGPALFRWPVEQRRRKAAGQKRRAR